MVKLILTRTELEMLLLWGRSYEGMSKQVGLPLEPDETRLIEKLRKKYNSRLVGE